MNHDDRMDVLSYFAPQVKSIQKQKEKKLKMSSRSLEIKNVKFSNPATIVFWEDGTKTVVKAQNEPFDPEKGLAMAIAKRVISDKGNYYNEFRRWLATGILNSSEPDSGTVIGSVTEKIITDDGVMLKVELYK